MAIMVMMVVMMVEAPSGDNNKKIDEPVFNIGVMVKDKMGMRMMEHMVGDWCCSGSNEMLVLKILTGMKI